MNKRRYSEDHGIDHPVKRPRTTARDHLSILSDELLLRILSFLPISDLIRCQSISRRFRTIAGDSQLWKAAYYSRFVRPRASRLPSIRDSAISSSALLFSSKLSKWLDEEKLVQRGTDTNWKRQYKLRHNWSRGSCNMSEIKVAEETPIPHLLVRLHEGVIFTADASTGLRAWSLRDERKLLASTSLDPSKADNKASPPTALAVGAGGEGNGTHQCVVACGDGSFSVYELNEGEGSFRHRYSHAPSSNGTISAIAIASPYLLTMTETHLLSLYEFPEPDARPPLDVLDPPRLLSSLKSHTVWPPLSISLRLASRSLLASIAYSLPTYLSGWSVGIQELRFTSKGEIIDSRLASAIGQGFHPLNAANYLLSPSTDAALHASVQVTPEPAFSKPLSLSYSHPYLLVSHSDNTLTLYLVSSDSSALSISSGTRLWGHTSSVAGAHVGGRGKAVSVSARGDELRVWELEGGLLSSTSRKRLATGGLSVRIRPENKLRQDQSQGEFVPEELSQSRSSLELALVHKRDELFVTRDWVGFDEQSVVVLGERVPGRQALVVYDFS